MSKRLVFAQSEHRRRDRRLRRHIETKDVEWTDEHPLNQTATAFEAFVELFAPEPPMPKVLP